MSAFCSKDIASQLPWLGHEAHSGLGCVEEKEVAWYFAVRIRFRFSGGYHSSGQTKCMLVARPAGSLVLAGTPELSLSSSGVQVLQSFTPDMPNPPRYNPFLNKTKALKHQKYEISNPPEV